MVISADKRRRSNKAYYPRLDDYPHSHILKEGRRDEQKIIEVIA